MPFLGRPERTGTIMRAVMVVSILGEKARFTTHVVCVPFVLLNCTNRVLFLQNGDLR